VQHVAPVRRRTHLAPSIGGTRLAGLRRLHVFRSASDRVAGWATGATAGTCQAKRSRRGFIDENATGPGITQSRRQGDASRLIGKTAASAL